MSKCFRLFIVLTMAVSFFALSCNKQSPKQPVLTNSKTDTDRSGTFGSGDDDGGEGSITGTVTPPPLVKSAIGCRSTNRLWLADEGSDEPEDDSATASTKSAAIVCIPVKAGTACSEEAIKDEANRSPEKKSLLEVFQQNRVGYKLYGCEDQEDEYLYFFENTENGQRRTSWLSFLKW